MWTVPPSVEAIGWLRPQAAKRGARRRRGPSHIARWVGLGALYVATYGTVPAQNTISVSPNGRLVAYVVGDTLRIVAVDGSRAPTAVANVKTWYTVPGWSADSDRL